MRTFNQYIKVVITMIMLLFAVFLIFGQANAQPAVTGHRAFADGEELTYNVKYAFIKGGEAHFVVKDTVMSGRKVHHIVCGGRTTGLPDKFYKVRDVYESYIDVETQLPVHSIRNISEGNYKYYDCLDFDHSNSTVAMRKVKRGKTTDSIHTVPARTQDIIGAFYHARNNAFGRNIQIGDTIHYNTFFGGSLYPLSIRVVGREAVKTAWGKKVECFKFAPITEVGRSFKSQDGMRLWVSDDANRLPIKIEFEMPVGSFVFELAKCEGLSARL